MGSWEGGGITKERKERSQRVMQKKKLNSSLRIINHSIIIRYGSLPRVSLNQLTSGEASLRSRKWAAI